VFFYINNIIRNANVDSLDACRWLTAQMYYAQKTCCQGNRKTRSRMCHLWTYNICASNTLLWLFIDDITI